MDQLELPIRNPAIYSALRRFIDEALSLLRDDVAAGNDVSFSVGVHHEVPTDHGIYDFRPLTEGYIKQRAERINELPATDEASWVISSDPAAGAWLRAGRADVAIDMQTIARDELLYPLLMAMGELHSDFTFDEDALLRTYMRFEKSLYGEDRRFIATTPIWGLRLAYGDLQLAEGVRLRQVDPVMFRMEWPEAAQLNWGDRGRDGLPTTVLEFERVVKEHDTQAHLDPVPAVEQVVACIRALAGGSIAAGPYVLERLDFRTLAPRPVSAIAAARCGKVPSKVDATVARALPGALRRLAADPSGSLSRAIERYQMAATAKGMASLRLIFDTLVDIYSDESETMSAGFRLAVVAGASLPERHEFLDAMQQADELIREGAMPSDASAIVTRRLAAGLRATIAAALVGELPLNHLQGYADGVLLGDRARRNMGASVMQPVLHGS